MERNKHAGRSVAVLGAAGSISRFQRDSINTLSSSVYCCVRYQWGLGFFITRWRDGGFLRMFFYGHLPYYNRTPKITTYGFPVKTHLNGLLTHPFHSLSDVFLSRCPHVACFAVAPSLCEPINQARLKTQCALGPFQWDILPAPLPGRPHAVSSRFAGLLPERRPAGGA